MKAIRVSEGNSIDHTPGSALAAGAVVVQGELIGIARTAIAAGVLGAIAVSGVYDVEKATGVVAAGALVYWDATAGLATTTAASNKLMGKAAAGAASGDARVRVLLTP